jgi:hypothetical protein
MDPGQDRPPEHHQVRKTGHQWRSGTSSVPSLSAKDHPGKQWGGITGNVTHLSRAPSGVREPLPSPDKTR